MYWNKVNGRGNLDCDKDSLATLLHTGLGPEAQPGSQSDGTGIPGNDHLGGALPGGALPGGGLPSGGMPGVGLPGSAASKAQPGQGVKGEPYIMSIILCLTPRPAPLVKACFFLLLLRSGCYLPISIDIQEMQVLRTPQKLLIDFKVYCSLRQEVKMLASRAEHCQVKASHSLHRLQNHSLSLPADDATLLAILRG